eukprot:SAG31_NODE_1061_length_10108_cov_5.521930_7_plen_142_part_00
MYYEEVVVLQATTVDENADADASVNYHNAMVANNGTSELWRIPPEHERCYCIGQADDPAAVDSPLLGQCPKFSGGMAPVPPCNQKEEWCRPVNHRADAHSLTLTFTCQYFASDKSIASAGHMQSRNWLVRRIRVPRSREMR